MRSSVLIPSSAVFSSLLHVHVSLAYPVLADSSFSHVIKLTLCMLQLCMFPSLVLSVMAEAEGKLESTMSSSCIMRNSFLGLTLHRQHWLAAAAAFCMCVCV